MKLFCSLLLFYSIIFSNITLANEFSYDAIAKRYGEAALNSKQLKSTEMHGECLVGLKDLNFKKKGSFDPVAEWTSLRTISLLEQYSPCEVLIIMEVAQQKLNIRQP